MSAISKLIELVPSAANGWCVDDHAVVSLFPIVNDYAGVPQDPIHHAEGDVRVHTRMVLDVLASHAQFRALTADDRTVVFLACLLHDVAKPQTTARDVDGRITARGHSARGAMLARSLLWELGVPPMMREAVCGLVRFHQVPFFLIDEAERVAERKALRIAEVCRNDLLQLVAWADAAGRHCHDQQKLLERVALFGELTKELGVERTPFAFTDEHSRFRYFRDMPRTRHDVAFDDTKAEVVLLVGFPASGKDRWCHLHAGDRTIISLDALRARHNLSHEGSQTRVADLGFERMKVALRQHQSVVWNATNLVRDLRSGIIDVADAYHARVRIVVFEASPDTLRERNRQRDVPVPESVYRRMAERWDMPDRTEAHVVDMMLSDA